MTSTATKTRPAPAKPVTAKATPTPKESPAKEQKPAPAKPEPTCLIDALTTRQASLTKVRANGTKRSLPYLAVGTDERKAAEAVAARIGEGETLAAVAEDMKVSLATARRFVTNLALAHDVEAGTHDAAWTNGTREVVVHRVVAKPAKA